jgi:hypothetical protein
MRSVTSRVFRVVKCSSTLVGALQLTGDRGPVSCTISAPPVAAVGADGAEVEAAVDELGLLLVDRAVEDVPGVESLPLEQAASTTIALNVAIRARHGRGITRS